MATTQYYSDPSFDRLGVWNKDHTGTYRLVETGKRQVIPLLKGKFYRPDNATTKPLIVDTPPALIPHEDELIFLGQKDGVTYYAADLSNEAPALIEATFGPGKWVRLRSEIFQYDHIEGALLAYAQGLLMWHHKHQFCGHCGHRTKADQHIDRRTCTNDACGNFVFPRLDPAIIVLIEHKRENLPPRCLLNMFETDRGDVAALFAGFVEICESLEDAAVREMKEEIDVEIQNLKYFGSQPWPFPSSLMIGMTAEVTSDYFKIDPKEIKAAEWYTAQEIVDQVEAETLVLAPKDSIARALIDAWLEKHLQK